MSVSAVSTYMQSSAEASLPSAPGFVDRAVTEPNENWVSQLQQQQGQFDPSKEIRTWDGQVLEEEDMTHLNIRREGVIYQTPDPYVGSTVDLEQRDAWATDGIDRSKAKIVDTFIEGDKLDRYTKERAAIENAGGLSKLRNKIMPPDPSGNEKKK